MRRTLIVLSLVLGLAGVGLSGCGDDEAEKPKPAATKADKKLKRIPPPEGVSAVPDDRTVIHLMTTKVGAKNVFIPSTLVLSTGSGQVLSIYNDTELPHGIEIPGLGVEATLAPGEENQVMLPPLRKSGIYDVRCQMHPPHRHASLVVVQN